jgi:predicted GNAT family N-acyltransferase
VQRVSRVLHRVRDTASSMSGERIIAIDTASALISAVFRLRHEVFVIEQAVPTELERDEFDGAAVHLVALRHDTVVGTLRIVADADVAKVGRMAVAKALRKMGIGSRLIERAAALAKDMGIREMVLHAQITAIDFYRRHGFREEGEIFEEAGIRHVRMRKRISSLLSGTRAG